MIEATGTGGAQTEMPRYKSHKEVWALKIQSIKVLTGDLTETVGAALITPVDPLYGSFPVSAEYVAKHNPFAGGYYVVYKDGYKSFSPAEAFEDGYTLVS